MLYKQSCFEIPKLIKGPLLSTYHPILISLLTVMPSIAVDTTDAVQVLTGKSFSEALILASTNPKCDKRLFIHLPVQYMKTTRSQHVVYINCLECQNKNKKTIYVHNMF